MGAEQSAPKADGQGPVAAVRKTCYYEVLGVDRQAAEDEIKKAYRRKALELHPDRNLNDTANATRRFAEVQTAYEILSDPQERAWYDSHRDAILGGDADISGDMPPEQSGGQTSATAIFSLMGRFNSSVPMTDSPAGFFGILNAFFDQLAAEEAAACEWGGITPTDYPPFGSAQDDYDSVAKPFYRIWSSFSTKKSFSWRDKHRLSVAPDRFVRRLLEKENKKIRAAAIREYNDAVLSLVAFVKKRDPRYVPNTQSEEERQRILRNSAAAQAARARAAHQSNIDEFTVPEWAQSRPEDKDCGDNFSMSEEESEVEHIECVVCNKTFKSEKQFESHEKSKKHIKAVQEIRRQMRKENADFDLENQESGPSSVTDSQAAGEEDQKEDHRGDADQVHDEGANRNSREETSTDDDEDDEYAPRSTVESRIVTEDNQETSLDKEPAASVSGISAALDELLIDETATGKKKGKAKQKRERKAARQALDAEEHNCAVCRESFTSRTKLFAHIKELGHAAPIPRSKGGNKQRR